MSSTEVTNKSYREHEEGGGEVEGVRPGQAHHQGVEGVDLLGVAGEQEDEEHVADDPDDRHDHQQQTLHIELKCLGELFRCREIHHDAYSGLLVTGELV